MNPRKVTRMLKVMLILIPIVFQQTLAFSLAKDLVVATILTQILKPRIVPIPIPFRFPVRFVKNTYKRYFLPAYSQSYDGYRDMPFSYDMDMDSLDSSDYKTVQKIFENSVHDGLSGSSDFSYSPGTSLPSAPHNIQGIMNHDYKLRPASTNQMGSSVHDDIAAIGGFDVLEDIAGLGDNRKWWKK